MPDSLRILLADDDPQIRETQPTSIVDDLEAVGITATVEPVGTVAEALVALQTRQFHCAIIDLRFNGESGAGNSVLQAIVEERALPVIVYSGHPDELEEQFEPHQLIFPVTNKIVDEVTEKIIEWNTARIFDFFTDTGFLASQLSAAIRRTMWKHLSPRWDHLGNLSADELQQTVARLAATVVHDQLSSDPRFAAAGGEVCIHPAEIYVFDSPREYLAAGDVITLNEQLNVVLTPSCDLVARGRGKAKARQVLLAECESLESYARSRREFGEALKALLDEDGDIVKEAENNMDRLMRHAFLNDDGRRFFLPPFAEFGGGVIDFLRLSLHPYDRAGRETLVQARAFSLSPVVAAELATRYARYMNRLGQAPYYPDAIAQSMTELARRTNPDPAAPR